MSKREGNVEQVERRFLTDVADHEMTIVHESELFRHIGFRRRDSGFYSFNLMTWPGFLCISGDMGCYVFSRITDMFEFFRGTGQIDYRYWAEKLQAVDRNSPALEWSEKEFWANVVDAFRQHVEHSQQKDYRRRLIKKIRERLECVEGDDDSIRAMVMLEIDGQHPFEDFYEYSCKDYTHQFVWCCQAIRWGINQYDTAKRRWWQDDRRREDVVQGGSETGRYRRECVSKYRENRSRESDQQGVEQRGRGIHPGG